MKSLFLSILMLIVSIDSVSAMDFEVEFFDGRPILKPTIHVTMTGRIERGDSEKLERLLSEYDTYGMREFLLIIDSPGGNLMEGLRLGKVIAARPEIAKAQIGTWEMPNAVCASACVFAYLGAEFRYLSMNGRIGVHQFNDPDSQLSGYDAIAMTQEITADLVSFIRSRNVDTALFERMSRTDLSGIDWVSPPELKKWRVVTSDVGGEWSEYINVEGRVALELRQISANGENRVVLYCSRQGVSAVAFLHEPEAAVIGRFELVIDSRGYDISDFEVAGRVDYRTRVLFDIPPNLLERVANAKGFGARIVMPNENLYYGFEQTIRDAKLKELVDGCKPSKSPAANSGTSLIGGMTVISGVDLLGGDLTTSGIRNISFQQCQQICMQYPQCHSVSYVMAKAWCWPKGGPTQQRKAPTVISAIKAY